MLAERLTKNLREAGDLDLAAPSSVITPIKAQKMH
jgi:hypothetical protein